MIRFLIILLFLAGPAFAQPSTIVVAPSVTDDDTTVGAPWKIGFIGSGVEVTAPSDGSALVTITGGSGSPGGSDTQVQFNDGGNFGGDSGLTYNKTNDRLGIGTSSPAYSLDVKGNIRNWDISNVAGNIPAQGDYSLVVGKFIDTVGSVSIGSRGRSGVLVGGVSYSGSDLSASHEGGLAWGFVSDDTTAGSQLFSRGMGSVVMGYSHFGSQLFTDEDGAFAFGYVTDDSVIQSNAQGSFAMGSANNGGDIEADYPGSFAFGYSKTDQIAATDVGAIAFGNADSGQIYADGKGAIAGGYGSMTDAEGGGLYARGNGSIAFGENVQTRQNNSVVLGKMVDNTITKSLMVGFNETMNTTPVFYVDSINVGVGTKTPLAKLSVSGRGYFSGQVTADSAEFIESDTNPTCASGNYTIYADTSEAKLKKCTNGVLTDLDTNTGAATAYDDIADPDENSTIVFGTYSNTWTGGIHDFGAVTSFEITNGTGPTVDAAGEIAVDTTDDQLIFFGGAARVIPYEREKCITIENLAAADDNILFGSFVDAPTVKSIWCSCSGTCTTKATISLEDDAGNAFTMATPTCATSGAATATTVTTDTIVAYEPFRFDVTNTPSPETDEYSICVSYTNDQQ